MRGAEPFRGLDDKQFRWCLIIIAGGLLIYALGQVLVPTSRFPQWVRRVELWKVSLTFLGEIVALAWFISLLWASFVQRKPILRLAESAKPRFKWMAISLLAALGVDAGASIWLHANERSRFDAAIRAPAPGSVDQIDARLDNANITYIIDATFTDRANQVHRAQFRIKEHRSRGFPEWVPNAVARSLKAKAVPFPLDVKYDPAWPARNWPADITWSDTESSIYTFCLILLGLQVFGALNYLAYCGKLIQQGSSSWWLALDRVVPLFPIACMGYLAGPFMLFPPG